METNKIEKTEEEWKEELGEERYNILRKAGTEAPFSGEHLNNHEEGMFTCGACGAELFDSKTKFDSGSGWPSFDKAIEGAVILEEDRSHGMVRTEAKCAKCDSHLGHVFPDGPTETGARYCINSLSLDHNPNS